MMSFHEFLARHSSAGEFIVLVASCIPAALGTRKLLQEIKEKNGIKKAWCWTELVFFWLLPVMFFLSTKAVDWASDDALRKVRSEMQVEIDETKAANLPKPFDERLRAFLDRLNPVILTSLRNGTNHFAGELSQSQLNDLKQLASEPEAVKYIVVHFGDKVYVNSGGLITSDVKFEVSNSLLKP